MLRKFAEISGCVVLVLFAFIVVLDCYQNRERISDKKNGPKNGENGKS